MIEGGRVNRISVAVLVDGTYGKNDKGDATYQPRSKEEIDQIAALVRTAIGFDQKRGDQVQVVNLRFAETAVASDHRAERLAVGAAIHQGRHHARRSRWWSWPSSASSCCCWWCGRWCAASSLRTSARWRHCPRADASGRRPPGAGDRRPAESVAAKAEPSQTAKMIDIAQVQGQVHAQSVQKVGDLADKNPRETVSIIRQWLQRERSR